MILNPQSQLGFLCQVKPNIQDYRNLFTGRFFSLHFFYEL